MPKRIINKAGLVLTKEEKEDLSVYLEINSMGEGWKNERAVINDKFSEGGDKFRSNLVIVNETDKAFTIKPFKED